MHKPFVHKPKLSTMSTISCTVMHFYRKCAVLYDIFFRVMNWFMHTQLRTIYVAYHFAHQCARIRAQLSTNSYTRCVCMNQCRTMDKIVRTPLVCRSHFTNVPKLSRDLDFSGRIPESKLSTGTTSRSRHT